MAITAANLTDGIDTSAGTSATTASITPTGNRLLLAIVASHRSDSVDPAAPSLSGNGLTWVQIGTALWDSTSSSRRRVTLFRAMGASPSAGAVTIDFAGQTQANIAWAIDEFDGVDTSGTNGSGAIVQTADSTAGINASIEITLGAFSDAGNATYGGFGCAGDTGIAGTGFTILGQGGSFANSLAVASEFKDSNDTSVDLTWQDDPAQSSGGTAVEIKAAAAGGTAVKDIIGMGFIPFAR